MAIYGRQEAVWGSIYESGRQGEECSQQCNQLQCHNQCLRQGLLSSICLTKGGKLASPYIALPRLCMATHVRYTAIEAVFVGGAEEAKAYTFTFNAAIQNAINAREQG